MTVDKISSNSTAVTLAGQSAFFLVGNVFVLVVGFLFQIYLAKHLGASGLGIFGLLDSGIQVLSGLLSFGVAQTMMRFISHHVANKEYGEVRLLIRKGFLVLLNAGIAGYGCILLSIPLIDRQWPQLSSAGVVIPIMGLLLPLGLIMYFMSQSLRGLHEIRYMVIGTSFLQLSLKIAITGGFFMLGYELLGYIGAVVISTAAATLWMAVGLRKKLQALPEAEKESESKSISQWRSYASVMYANSLLGSITAPLDRFLLGYFLSAGYVGIIMIARTIQQLPGYFLQMFLTVIAPMFSAGHAREDRAGNQHLYYVSTDWLMRLSLPLIIFLSIFAGPVLSLFGSEFAEKGKISLWLLLAGQLVNLAAGPIGNIMNMSGLEQAMLRISVLQTIITGVLLVSLIPLIGIEGAAIGISLGMIYANFAALRAAHREIDIHWWDRRFMRWLFPSFGCLLTGSAFRLFSPASGLLMLTLILIVLYCVFHGSYLLSGLNADDKEVWLALRTKLTGVRSA